MMEKLLCKLIALFISVGLAVAAQANVIGSNSVEFNRVAKGNYSVPDKSNSWKAGYEEGGQYAASKDAGQSRQHANLNASLFGGNMLSILQDATSLVRPSYDVSIYDVSFANEVRGFERERFNFGLAGESAAGNLLDRVKVNTHVPESMSIVLFAVGLFSLVMARRKIKA